jgi:hypothetical protein
MALTTVTLRRMRSDRDSAAFLPTFQSFVENCARSLWLRSHSQSHSAIAHFPGLRPFVEDGYVRWTPFQRIDDYRDNWWCDDVGGIPDDLNFSKQYDGSLRRVTQLNQRLEASPPVFLTTDQEAQASSEWEHLLSLGSAADYLPREIVCLGQNASRRSPSSRGTAFCLASSQVWVLSRRYVEDELAP